MLVWEKKHMLRVDFSNVSVVLASWPFSLYYEAALSAEDDQVVAWPGSALHRVVRLC